ncbi:hypothetical protein G6F56_000485 [Rhizopus delemar]|uniref:Uncharacterized protein n=1 Tax=Rhizopus stolonifer TaxID=4846 RepID=A0A367KYM5_RHIST|nr:hypothetical protein G6F56_000485 [Rhizopus delemar]RCI06992.1 hypothetical protein CU098_013486 [Rhizopus stolonifer]
MDCEFDNASDILFPSDTGLAKLSSPLDYKIPEAMDWATQDFMFTFHDKSMNELNNFLSFKKYIPVQEEPALNEEKQILSQMTQRLAAGNAAELHDSLKAFFHSIQSSLAASQTELALPGLSWAEEANEYYGGNDIGNLDSVQELEGKRLSNVAPTVDIDIDLSSELSSLSDSLPQSEKSSEKPLPALPKKTKLALLKKLKTKTRKVIQKLFHVS